MPKVLGIDSSTQSLSAVVLDTDLGTLICEETVNFGKDVPHFRSPSGFLPDRKKGEVHADPLMWVEALDLLFARLRKAGAPLDEVAALSVSGQQHGSVYLDGVVHETFANLNPLKTLAEQFSPALTRRTSPIWMDVSTSAECREIAEALGGAGEVCARSGSVPTERFTGPQIRKFFKNQPESYEKTGCIHLVSSFIASILAGKSVGIDRGDGAGMNLMNLAADAWDPDLLEATAPGLADKLPSLKDSRTVAGPPAHYFTSRYSLNPNCQVVIGTGDNPSSLVGMGATAAGKMVISLGTSDTLFAAMDEPLTDPRGFGHVFGNPLGGFMSLICFRNGSLAREAVKRNLGLDWSDFDAAGLAKTPPGNEGRVMVPFFKSEITPRVDSDGPVRNYEAEKTGPEVEVRAVLEGQFLNMRLHSQWLKLEPETILLTGGASENEGIAQLLADVFNTPVARLKVSASAALGAALRAAEAGCGIPMESLEKSFCQTEPGSRLEPNPGSAEIYDPLVKTYEDLLKSLTTNNK